VNTMNTPPNAMPESSRDSQINDSPVVAPAVLAATRPFYWSLRRELWENRSIYIAPLAVAALILFGFMISTVHLPDKMRAASALDPMKLHEMIEQPYDFAELLLMGTFLIVAVFYCLDALHGERRDRSILFWKSLPVSDVTTVLSKASIPLLVLPLLTWAVTIATQWFMLLLSSAVLLGSGQSAATLWTHLPLFQMWMGLLYHLVFVHGFYFAPVYGWLMLVSGWARRMAFLWAGLPMLAISIVEKIAFNTTYFATMLGSRLAGGEDAGALSAPGHGMDPLTVLSLAKFLISPGMLIGLAIFAAFLVAAIRLRRYQGPI
jgi:ABC-2 type transport system permease protein